MTPKRFGNYRLIREIGQGGFATVYLARHEHLKAYAAIKVLHGMNAHVEKFRQEAQTLMDLRHPNIIRLLDFGMENGTPYLIMDYALNGSLRLQYPRQRVLPVASLLTYVHQIAEALQYAHDRHIVHRDVKPENMLIGRERRILLSDFGIALQGQDSSRTRDVAGTLSYMAPEQMKGKPKPASDQYALGIVVYEWLTGRRPFEGNAAEITAQHLEATPPPLHTSPDVSAVVLRALKKQPSQRYPTVQGFADALIEAAGGELRCSIDERFVTEAASYTMKREKELGSTRSQQAKTRTARAENPWHRSMQARRKTPRRVLLAAGFLGIGSVVASWAVNRTLQEALVVFSPEPSTPIPTHGETLTPELTPTQVSESPKTSTPSSFPREITHPVLMYKQQAPNCCAWSPDGKRIASGAADGTTQVLDANGHVQFTCQGGHTAGVANVAWEPSGKALASASFDKTVRVWESSGGKLLMMYGGHTDWVKSVAWEPSGKRIASASSDKTVHVWESSGKLLMTYNGHTQAVNSIAWSPDGKYIASGSNDKTVHVWESNGGKLLMTYSGHTNTVESVAWSPDSKRIASGSSDFTAQVWDMTRTLFIYREHNQIVRSIAWEPSGNRIASGGADVTVRIWDMTRTQFIYSGHTDWVQSVAWSPSGSRIASTGASELFIWQA